MFLYLEIRQRIREDKAGRVSEGGLPSRGQAQTPKRTQQHKASNNNNTCSSSSSSNTANATNINTNTANTNMTPDTRQPPTANRR